jgi:hypothetical protein
MLPEAGFQGHEFVIVGPYVFVPEKKGEKMEEITHIYTLIYCNLLRS